MHAALSSVRTCPVRLNYPKQCLLAIPYRDYQSVLLDQEPEISLKKTLNNASLKFE